MSTLLININEQDCVGDSLGKYNYNFSILDTTICNLSSILFTSQNSVLSVFDYISAQTDYYNQFAQTFSDSSVSAYDLTDTTVDVLSSYWHVSEFSLMYPITALVNSYTTQTAQADLENATHLYLNSDYNATNYTVGTRANVILPLYNFTNNLLIDQQNHIYINNQLSSVNTVSNGWNALRNHDYDANGIQGFAWDGNNIAITNTKGERPYNAGNISVLSEFTKTTIKFDDIRIFKYYVQQDSNGINQWVLSTGL